MKDSVSKIQDFEGRLKNLTLSKAYLDSIRTVVTILYTKQPSTYKFLLPKIDSIFRGVEFNEQKITTLLDELTNGLPKNFVEIGNLVDGNTISGDLQTVSKRRFTLEAGLAAMNLKDNLDRQKYLWKPFIGVIWHFRPLDKTGDLTRINPPDSGNKQYSHSLESKYNFWQRVSVTLGLTLGPMTNKDFDNFYGNFCFLLGPSI